MYWALATFAKLTKFILNTLKIGYGYTFPGFLILKLFPNSLGYYKNLFPKGVILISGTNGKTTTAKLITHLLKESGFTVTHNTSGANLPSGILTHLLLSTNVWGRVQSDVAVFEVDEFHLPALVKALSPEVLVLLNLSRDQLDRYGEVDTILSKWQKCLAGLPATSHAVIDATQNYLHSVTANFAGTVTYFEAATFKPRSFFEQFSASNIAAALTCGALFGLAEDVMLDSLLTIKPAFGRGETITYQGKSYHILLAKNPASFNYNLSFLLSTKSTFDQVIFALNDNIPDGRDVSWIYDIDAKALRQFCEGKHIVVSGIRYLDMALRLDYAGVDMTNLSLISDIQKAVAGVRADNCLVLPNYSAMLEVRKILQGRKIL